MKPSASLDFEREPRRLERRANNIMNGSVREDDLNHCKFIMTKARQNLKSKVEYRPCVILSPEEYLKRKTNEGA